jgi:hypothetical protein
VLADEGTKWLAAHFLALSHPELSLGERMPAKMPQPPAEAGPYGASGSACSIGAC